jgi:hypothetical protein
MTVLRRPEPDQTLVLLVGLLLFLVFMASSPW